MSMHNNKGATVVETAIILPLLFLIVIGIFEFGRAMFMVNTLNNVAREGARRAAVSTVPINIDAAVTSGIPFNRTGLVITTSNTAPAAGSGVPITVTVTIPFRTVTGIIPLLDGTILRGEATMRYEL